jgi:hypothetical protein
MFTSTDGHLATGATYRLRRAFRQFGKSYSPGEQWVFWRDVYSAYDGLHFYHFAPPDEFYGPPQADLKAVRTMTWVVPDAQPEDVATWFELIEPARPGLMWMVDRWAATPCRASRPQAEAGSR